MSALHDQLAGYFAVRRALGCRLEREDKLLAQFLDYLEERGIEQITVDAALAWATLPARTDSYHAHRLGAVRGFARHLQAMELPVKVPPSDLLPNKPRRAVPYIYTDAEIAALMEAAGTLHPAHRVATVRTLVGLLAVTGMRRGEAIALDRDDFDPVTGVLIVRAGKFGKSRELPLHPTTITAVTEYLQRHDRPQPADPTAHALLLGENGRRFSPHTANHTFRALAVKAGLRPRSERCRPRKHDLRHTLAVRTLLDAELIGEFLEHLERDRGCSAKTRNCRLTAIRSLLRYAARRHPEHALVIERVLAIPPKRRQRTLITFLTEPEIDALIDAPDRSTWTGRRDQAMLALATQTGLRASELIGLTIAEVRLGAGAHVNCVGKGRKQRITPLTKTTVTVLRAWLAERGGQPPDPLFPTSQGRQLSRDALERRLTKLAIPAGDRCPSLRAKRVTPHVLRHAAAMRLLHAAVDTTVIALWLGHEQVETTHIYLHADLAIKERALARTTPTDVKPGRYKAPDPLLAFLEAL